MSYLCRNGHIHKQPWRAEWCAKCKSNERLKLERQKQKQVAAAMQAQRKEGA